MLQLSLAPAHLALAELFGGSMAASDQFYYEIQEEVDGVIGEFGKEFDIRTPGEYDDQTMTTLPDRVRKVSGVVADQQFASQLVPNGWLATKTLVLTASASPAKGEEIQVDGKWFGLEKIMQVKPADVVVCYMLDVTR